MRMAFDHCARFLALYGETRRIEGPGWRLAPAPEKPGSYIVEKE